MHVQPTAPLVHYLHIRHLLAMMQRPTRCPFLARICGACSPDESGGDRRWCLGAPGSHCLSNSRHQANADLPPTVPASVLHLPAGKQACGGSQSTAEDWSGRRESNPRSLLGREMCHHNTSAALTAAGFSSSGGAPTGRGMIHCLEGTSSPHRERLIANPSDSKIGVKPG